MSEFLHHVATQAKRNWSGHTYTQGPLHRVKGSDHTKSWCGVDVTTSDFSVGHHTTEDLRGVRTCVRCFGDRSFFGVGR